MTKRTRALDITQTVKKQVWERDNHQCILCGNPQAMPNAHYIARSHGGVGVEENITTLCLKCHNAYDNTAERSIIKKQIKSYLKSKYPDWDESKLTHSKY